MLTVELNMYHGVALGAFLFWLGGMITDKVSLLNRYCIPAPLVGGLCFSILNCILYSAGIASITFDATLQTVFMIMFFTTVGFTVSIPTLLRLRTERPFPSPPDPRYEQYPLDLLPKCV